MNARIFGYTWEEIQAMQQKQYTSKVINPSSEKKKASDADIELLRLNGVSGLVDMQFFGVLDRLVASGLIKKEW